MLISSLKNQADFDLVNKRGRKLSSRSFIFVVVKNYPKAPKDLESGLFVGMKVSRKASKKAVVRNKIKRRIRHLIQLANKKVPSFAFCKPGLIVIPKKGLEEMPFTRLMREFETIYEEFS